MVVLTRGLHFLFWLVVLGLTPDSLGMGALSPVTHSQELVHSCPLLYSQLPSLQPLAAQVWLLPHTKQILFKCSQTLQPTGQGACSCSFEWQGHQEG